MIPNAHCPNCYARVVECVTNTGRKVLVYPPTVSDGNVYRLNVPNKDGYKVVRVEYTPEQVNADVLFRYREHVCPINTAER